MHILEVRNLSKFYKDTPALKGVSLDVKKGELVAVIGRSGAGKSTLLRCINRMIEPTSGSLFFEGVEVLGLKKHALRRVRRSIGMIFQHYNLVYRQNVIENVLHGRLGYKSSVQGMFGSYSEEEKVHALSIIEKLGLQDQIYQRCDTLSGGQKQRVGIARALIQDPKLILCDEPIASLDPGSAKVIMDHLRDISHDLNIAVLVNLHQVDVAKYYADRIIGIKEGEIIFEGKADKLGKKLVHEIYGSDVGDMVSE